MKKDFRCQIEYIYIYKYIDGREPKQSFKNMCFVKKVETRVFHEKRF